MAGRECTAAHSHTDTAHPLPHFDPITNAHDALRADDRVAPKACLRHPCRVFSPPELHEHLVRHRRVAFPRARIHIRQLHSRFCSERARSGKHEAGRRTRQRAHLDTSVNVRLSMSASVHPPCAADGWMTIRRHASSANGTPDPLNTIFGRNLQCTSRRDKCRHAFTMTGQDD